MRGPGIRREILRASFAALAAGVVAAGYLVYSLSAPYAGFVRRDFRRILQRATTAQICAGAAAGRRDPLRVGVPAGALHLPRPQAAGRRVSLRQAGFGARRLRPHRARRRVLYRAGGAGGQEHVRYRALAEQRACFRRPISWPRRATRRPSAISIRARRRSKATCFPAPIA